MFLAVARATDDAIWDWNLETDQVWWNQSYQLAFGHLLERNPGPLSTWVDYIHADDRARVKTGILGVIEARGEQWSAEYGFLRADGSLARIYDRGVVIYDDQGKPVRMVGAMQDLSARQLAEGRYRTLFDYAPDGIVIADAQSYYVDANPSICRMLGYTREELIGLHASDIVMPQEVAEIGPALATLQSEQDHQREWQFRRKDGTTFSAEVIATALPDGQLMGLIRDVTERKRAEEQFLRAQRMESLGTLAGGIAHDLNNVLAPILMSINLLAERARDEQEQELLATLHASATRGADLVKQVLSFARGVEGQRVTVNPLRVLDDLLRVLRETFPKSIEVTAQVGDGLWTVTGDSTQIQQVLLNLCVNARDAMPTGGRLRISLENVLRDGADPYVRLEVVDTGTGIPKELQDRIFEPFFTTKEVGAGTGLGLSTTLAIVKSHRGFLAVSSEPNQGTKFEVYLPANAEGPAAEPAEPAAVAKARLPRGQGELILVVDDEEAVRKVVRRILERQGYRVLEAAQGAEAVSLYARHPEIDVILTDMAMPIMDGPALILAIRGMNPQARIVASSGLSPTAGVEHFVPKPYTAEVLLRTLRAALDD